MATRAVLGMVLALVMHGEAGAEGAAEARLQALEQTLDTQERALTEQRERLVAQEELLATQRREIEILRREILMESRAGSTDGAVAGSGTSDATRNSGQASSGDSRAAAIVVSEAETEQEPSPTPVGKPPPPKKESIRAPVVKAAKDVGGVLTEKGTLVIEPQLQLSTSQVNAFTFQGVEILDTFLVGLIEAQDNDRDFISPATFTGMTN
jgi:uncharacterized coiled-coil protein SlyX